MIYALEWYDIPRKCYGDLVEFHPYLNDGDFDRLNYINMQHYIEVGILGSLSFLVSNRMLTATKYGMMKQKFVRWPVALTASCFVTYVCSRLVLSTLYLNDLKELNLD